MNQQNQTNVLAAALGLMIRKFGFRCDGGYEIFIPTDVLNNIPPAGQIQHQIDPEGKGVYIRYFPNFTIDATPVDSNVAGQLEHAKEDEPGTA